MWKGKKLTLDNEKLRMYILIPRETKSMIQQSITKVPINRF